MTTINTNIGAINAQANMTRINDDMNESMLRLSSGLRINAAKDDAAGMAIAEKMTSQIKGLNQAVRNATDGKNLVDTTEGAHVEVSNMLQRLRELAVQSSNDTNTATNRNNLTSEARQLIAEINSVAENTTFNGMKVLDGSFTNKQLQIGADRGQTMTVNVDSAAATAIGANVARSQSAVTTGTGLTDTDDVVAGGVTITITGYAGSAEVETTAGQSARDLAAEMNKLTAQTGVEATATTAAKLSGFTTGDTVSFKIGTTAANAVSIGDVAIADSTDIRGLRDAINAVSGQTGITAEMASSTDNSAIVLRDANGDDIMLTDVSSTTTDFSIDSLDADGKSTGNAADLGQTSDSAAVTGTVEVASTKSFTVASSTAEHFANTTEGSELESVAEIDLTTADGAAKAIGVIDMALQKISQSRSDLGAVSNRLDSTISNLTNITVNVEAARSGVMDADFAKESSAMARGKILAQAATAMLAQANASQQNVLSLLRG
ncbi:flagellin [Roseicyclus mahoneyensis]|uniref:Flagellin n=1 Tax=Roseicyclus mahoneyensis TaxID=164332 RepID=A0A316GHI3_9RHOB|nr:flagellin [Roseicyclus mahoneyensis]PWK60411.1 flagellin [Roseicyclus mahoneyensis]